MRATLQIYERKVLYRDSASEDYRSGQLRQSASEQVQKRIGLPSKLRAFN